MAWRLNWFEMAVMLAGGLCAFDLLPAGEAAFATGFWLLAVIIVKSDLTAYLIPDWASFGMAGLGLAHAFFMAFPGDEKLPAAAAAVFNGLLAFGLFFTVSQAYYWLTKREGLGFGDVKLAGALGIWFDFAGFAICLQLTTFAALIVVLWQAWRGKAKRFAWLPLGAFLAPAAWATHMILARWPDFWAASLAFLGAS